MAGTIPTPKFAKPPVIETVLGIQFQTLEKLRAAHYGSFWQTVRDRFPIIDKDREPIEPVFERFDKPAPRMMVGWKMLSQPELPRAWFKSEESDNWDHLLQLQRDRFILNSRRSDPDLHQYRPYEQNRAAFSQLMSDWASFLRSQEIGELAVNQCEVTYINHIRVDEPPGAAAAFEQCFPTLAVSSSDDFLPPRERIDIETSYLMPAERGRLHVSIKSPVVLQSGRLVIDFRLTARGGPASPSTDDALVWLDLGHTWVTCGFRSLTSRAMHGIWEAQ